MGVGNSPCKNKNNQQGTDHSTQQDPRQEVLQNAKTNPAVLATQNIRALEAQDIQFTVLQGLLAQLPSR